MTYRDAGNLTRYVSILCNYDGNNNYNTVDMRIRGDGYNSAIFSGSTMAKLTLADMKKEEEG